MNANAPVFSERRTASTILNSGVRLDLYNPDPDMLDIDIIAQGLSNECRFSGQVNDFYSVAQHSVLVSELVAPEYAFIALMHDAAEAFVKDIPTPIKRLLPEYGVIEGRVWSAICDRYPLPLELPVEIHIADKIAVILEARSLFTVSDCEEWYPELEIPEELEDMTITALPPREAKALFIARFWALGGFES